MSGSLDEGLFFPPRPHRKAVLERFPVIVPIFKKLSGLSCREKAYCLEPKFLGVGDGGACLLGAGCLGLSLDSQAGPTVLLGATGC